MVISEGDLDVRTTDPERVAEAASRFVEDVIPLGVPAAAIWLFFRRRRARIAASA